MFERESRREKILEVRNREIRLKMKTKTSQVALNEEEDEKKSVEDLFADQHVQQAETEFYGVIKKETTPEEAPQPAEEHDEIHEDEEQEEEASAPPEPPPPPTPEPEEKPKKKKKKKKKT